VVKVFHLEGKTVKKVDTWLLAIEGKKGGGPTKGGAKKGGGGAFNLLGGKKVDSALKIEQNLKSGFVRNYPIITP